MTKPKRTRWSDEDRARALAIGRDRGAAAAEAETGIPSGTVRGWISRGAQSPEAAATLDAEVDVGRALEAEQTATGALSDGEWGEIQRRVSVKFQAALAKGDTLGTQRLSVVMGVCDSKLAERRKMREGPGDRHGHGLGEDWRDDNPEHARERLGKIISLMMGREAGQSVHDLQTADDAELDRNIGSRYRVIRRMEREIRWLHEERTRRSLGEVSLFGWMQDPQLSMSELRSMRPDLARDMQEAEGDPEPFTTPVPLEVADLQAAVSVESKYIFDERRVSAGERFDQRMEAARLRRRIRGHRVQGGKTLHFPHQGLREGDL